MEYERFQKAVMAFWNIFRCLNEKTTNYINISNVNGNGFGNCSGRN